MHHPPEPVVDRPAYHPGDAVMSEPLRVAGHKVDATADFRDGELCHLARRWLQRTRIPGR